jgi:D-lactate dehydrogenase (cytochrome)
MDKIRELDTANNTLTVEAGCILDNIHSAATDVNRFFPLSLPSSGTCMIGGNLAVNAGGIAVLRYGTARELCLGLEVVTGEGEIWDGLRSLRKDNTGYSLRDLFIGSEGTLGVITAAVLKLYPQPRTKLTAFAAMSTPDNALSLLNIAQKYRGTELTAFELVSQYAMKLVLKHFPSLLAPFPLTYGQYALIELSGNDSENLAADTLETFLKYAIEEGLIEYAVVAQSQAQSQNLWQLRENISAAQALEGKNIKHDIALPASSVSDFIAETDRLLQTRFPGCRMVTFGHLGDGSLHYNIAPPEDMPDDAFLAFTPEINRIVYDSTLRYNGTISAEHGLGALKREELLRYKSATEIAMMKKIKTAFDPKNLMNPGKVLL